MDREIPRAQPVSRSATLAYDKAANQLVLFGGDAAGFHYYDDTWTYNGVY